MFSEPAAESPRAAWARGHLPTAYHVSTFCAASQWHSPTSASRASGCTRAWRIGSASWGQWLAAAMPTTIEAFRIRSHSLRGHSSVAAQLGWSCATRTWASKLGGGGLHLVQVPVPRARIVLHGSSPPLSPRRARLKVPLRTRWCSPRRAGALGGEVDRWRLVAIWAAAGALLLRRDISLAGGPRPRGAAPRSSVRLGTRWASSPLRAGAASPRRRWRRLGIRLGMRALAVHLPHHPLHGAAPEGQPPRRLARRRRPAADARGAELGRPGGRGRARMSEAGGTAWIGSPTTRRRGLVAPTWHGHVLARASLLRALFVGERQGQGLRWALLLVRRRQVGAWTQLATSAPTVDIV